MKNSTIAKKLSWLLVIGFVSVLALSACKSSSAHEHPTAEHPTHEHPTTNPPPGR